MFKDKKNKFYIIILFLSVFIISIFKIYESDAFWHLKSGEYIIMNLKIPSHDPFTINGENKIWINTYWLFEVISYCIYIVSGFTGLIIFKSIICAFAFVSLSLAATLAGSNRMVAFVIPLFYLSIFRHRFLIRPDIFSFLFISLYLYIFMHFKFQKVNRFFLLPVLMLLWTNTHSGAFFGVILFWIFTTTELLTRLYNAVIAGISTKKILEEQKVQIFNLLISSLCFFISPAHYHSIEYLLSQWHVRDIIDIAEFRSIFDGENKIFALLLAINFLAIIISIRRVPVFLLLSGFVFLIPGSATVRMAYYALFVNLPVLMCSVSSFIKKVILINPPDFLKYLSYIILSAISVYLIIANDAYHYAGTGVRYIYFPEGHIKFVKRFGLKVNLFNSPNLGGGIIFAGYPELKAFVDTRIQVNESTLREINNAMKEPINFRSLLKKYKINALLVENRTGLIKNQLINPEEWGLVYWDDYSMLLLKKSEFSEFVKEHEIKIINPETIVLDLPGYLTSEALTERVIYHLKRSIAVNPEIFTANYAIAYLLLRKMEKNYREISKYLDRAYRIEPNFVPTLYEIANLYASVHDFYNALYFYKKIIHLERFYNIVRLYPTIYKEIGMVYLNLGEKRKAKKYLKKSLKIEPNDIFVIEQLNNL